MKKIPSTTKLIIGIAPLFLGSGIFGVTSPTFLMSIGAGADVLGSASSLGLILAVLFSPFFGRLGRRFSNRNATFTCLVINALTVFLCVLFPSVTSFTICRAVLRFVPTCAAVCSYAYLINIPTLEKLSSVKTILAQENPVAAFKRCLRSAPAGTPLLFVLVSAISIGYALFDQSFIYYLQIRLHVPVSMSGVVRAVIGAIAILVNFTITMALVQRFNSAKAIIPITLLCAAASGCAAFTGTEAAFIIAGGLFYASINVLLAFQNKIFGDFAAKGNSELLSSCNYTVDCFASAAGSLAAGFIYNIGPLLPYAGAAILYLCIPAVAVMIRRRAYSS